MNRHEWSKCNDRKVWTSNSRFKKFSSSSTEIRRYGMLNRRFNPVKSSQRMNVHFFFCLFVCVEYKPGTCNWRVFIVFLSLSRSQRAHLRVECSLYSISITSKPTIWSILSAFIVFTNPWKCQDIGFLPRRAMYYLIASFTFNTTTVTLTTLLPRAI